MKNKHPWARQACRLALASALFFSSNGMSAPVPWRDGSITYLSKGRALPQVLKDILATQPFPVVVQSDVRGEVNGQFNESARAAFFELQAAYGFTWYFDGSTMYIAPSSDNRSEVVAISPLSGTQAMRALADLGLVEPRFSLKVTGGSVLVSGPSRYVDLVARTLESERERVLQGLNQRNMSMIGALAKPPSSGSSIMEIRVFPLRYAQAQDAERGLRSDRTGSYIVPGVATLLRNLLQGAYASTRIDKDSLIDGFLAGDAMATLGAAPTQDGSERLRMQALLAILARQQSQGNPQEGSIDRNVHIQADVRTNSVVIFDTPAMMPIYAQLIEQLDRPQRLVQLDVAIIDIDSADARDLGVDLSLRGESAQLGTGGSGLSFQAVIGSSMPQLRARIALLETKGRAKILSRPKIMTLDNTEAFMGNEQSIYVRTSGDRYANLVPVSTGLSLRATPLVIPVEGRPARIKLSLEIVDGNFLNTSVDNVPGSSRKYIATQALVEDGQSLLVGGFQFENVNNNTSGVPGLSNVPGVGALFRRNSKSHVQVERLYLITPRVVDERLNDTTVVKAILPQQPATPITEASPPKSIWDGFTNMWATPSRSIDTAKPEIIPVKPLPPVPHGNDNTHKPAGKTKQAPSRPAPASTKKSHSDKPPAVDKPNARTVPAITETPGKR